MSYRRTGRELRETIEAVKKLSNTFEPKEIAEKLGLTYGIVIRMQMDKRNGITNPLRKYKMLRNEPKTDNAEFFSIEKYAREYIY